MPGTVCGRQDKVLGAWRRLPEHLSSLNTSSPGAKTSGDATEGFASWNCLPVAPLSHKPRAPGSKLWRDLLSCVPKQVD